MGMIRVSLLLTFLLAVCFLGALIHEEKGIVFYAGAKDGIFRITQDTVELFSRTEYSKLSVWQGRLYDSSSVYSFEGEKVLSEPLKVSHAQVVGFGMMARISSEKDTVTFFDMSGKVLWEYGMLHEPDNRLQDAGGVFIDENTFVLLNDGKGAMLKYSLKEGTITPFARLPVGKLGAMYFDRGYIQFYVASSDSIYRFGEGEEPIMVAKDLPGNITGMVVIGETIYFTSNFGDGLYRYAIDEGRATLIAVLNYPVSLVALPW